MLKGKSAVELEELAKKAKELANDLRRRQPTYALALEAGICDEAYNTVANGWVADYSGEAIIEMADGPRATG